MAMLGPELVAACAISVVFFNKRHEPPISEKTSQVSQIVNVGSAFGPGQATLVLGDKNLPANQLVLQVRRDQQRLEETSYSTIAAGLVTLMLAKDSSNVSDPHQAELRQQYSAGLAELSTRAIYSQKPNGPSSEGDFSFSTNIHGAYKGGCDALAKQLANRGLTITQASRKSECIVKYRSACMKVNPKASVDETIYFVNLLQSNQGDVSVLSRAANNVDVKLSAANAAPLPVSRH